ncbi:MAG: metallophosphoesterase [Dehalococcoidales bacterium]|nr:metallophosphoesterase [Dehalococcoidales bacterium]
MKNAADAARVSASPELNKALQEYAKERGIDFATAQEDFTTFWLNPERYSNVWKERGEPFRKIAQKAGLYSKPGYTPVISVSETGEKAIILVPSAKLASVAKLKGRAQFEVLQKLGIYPSDYEYAEWVKDGKPMGGIVTGQQVEAATQQIRDFKAWVNNVKNTDPEGYKIYLKAYRKDGSDAGVEAYNTFWQERLEQQLKDQPQVLQTAYNKTPGSLQDKLDAYNRALNEYNQRLVESTYRAIMEQPAFKRATEAQKDALESLATYGSADVWQQFQKTGIPGGQTYDIQKFITDHPTQASVDALRMAGFKKDIVDSAQAYVNEINKVITEINQNPKKWGENFAQNSVMQLQASSLGYVKKGIPGVITSGEKIHGVVYTGSKMVADFDKFWGNLSIDQKAQLAGAINSDPNRINSFAALMERVNDTYDKLPVAAQFIMPFTPYIGMPFLAAKSVGTTVAKKLTSQEVPKMEYLVDAATVVFASLPYIGGVLEKGIGGTASKFTGKYSGEMVGAAGSKVTTSALTGGSIAVLAKNLSDTWGDMTPGERAASISMLSLPFVGTGIRKAQFIKTVNQNDYVPLRSMSMEASTARVPFTDAQLARMRAAGISEADIIQAGTSINQQLVSGAEVAKVKLGPVSVKVKNVPYQRIVGKSIFQGTPDVTQIARGESVPLYRDFYAAAKVALEPMQRSYLTGQRATKPGIIEIRIDDPALLAEIGPQKRLISGGKTLEPEIRLPSLEELQGKGYRLEPIPGPVGSGVTFDASLGELQIRRFTLSRVTGGETGLIQIKTGGTGDGGVVGVGDLHATNKFQPVFNDINSQFDRPVIEGNPKNPDTWHWINSSNKGRTVIQLGDSIDRGTQYETWRRTFNRLQDEAKVAGDRVERLLGNHELAYISGDAIKGIKYTDASREAIRQALLEDIRAGRIKAAVSAEGKLFTHAGVSKSVFKEYAGKTPGFITKDLNSKLVKAVETDNFNSKMFAKGRVEHGNSLLRNERNQGGIFWLRPQEATPVQLNLGFPQVVGHNPGWAVRRVWGENFIETDVGRRTGGTGVYSDTPYMKTVSTDILTEPISGKAPELTNKVNIRLKLGAMRDTIADVFMGWDGRTQAVKNLVNNRKAVDALIKAIDKQIAERKAAGDSYGARYFERQREDLINPGAKDYLYGGIGFWRDLVMGRQNSVRILGDIRSAKAASLTRAVGVINSARNRITRLSNDDVTILFGKSKAEIERVLNTRNINRRDITGYRHTLSERLSYLRDIVDTGLERAVTPYMDREKILNDYIRRLQQRYTELARYPDRAVYNLTTGRVESRIPSERLPRAPVTPVPPAKRIPAAPPITHTPVPPTEPVPPVPPTERIPPPPPPPEKTPPPPPPKPPIKTKGGLTITKQLTPEEIRAAVAFRMGALKRGDKLEPVTHVHLPDKKITLVGKTPEGLDVAAGPNALKPSRTIQLIRKGDMPEITSKQGFARYRIDRLKTPGRPDPGKIRFSTGGSASRLKSQKVGKVYHTPVKGGTLMSRRPLGRHRIRG